VAHEALLLIGIASLATMACAAPTTALHAQLAVRAWLKTDAMPLQTRIGSVVDTVETHRDALNEPSYYVVYLKPSGFVIVPADDLVEPVIAFAPEGRYDPSVENPLGALIRKDVPWRMQHARAQTNAGVRVEGTLQKANNKWTQLRASGNVALGVTLGVSTISDIRVAPLTQTTWDQGTAAGTGNACYNYYTPPNPAGNAANYVCGCVATAMAQLMRFWQYPVNGVGTASFTIYDTDVAQSRTLRGGNGTGGSYDWNNMVLTPSGSSTPAQLQAIGALCADAGVSVHMDYNINGSGESGAYVSDVNGALKNTFQYANAVYGYNNNLTIGAGLNGMVNPNLDAGCPVLFGIVDAQNNGHAIVCDGYGYAAATLYHHLNLGWSGSYTAWYNLPNIDAGGYTFNAVDECVYNVWANGTGEIVSGRVTDNNGAAIAGATMTASRSGGGTYTTTTDSHGIYAFVHVPSSSQFTISPNKAGYSFSAQAAKTGNSADGSNTSGTQWGVNFASKDPNDPVGFSAIPVNASRIDLSWGKDPANDNVMVAWNTANTFGVPTGTYSIGGLISGGGVVLCNGSATNISHTGLSAGTKYYYKAWSVRTGPGYSSGVTCMARTQYGIPFAEGFEHAGAIPDDWTQEYVTGSLGWIFQTGGYISHPSSAHGGSYNAFLFRGDYTHPATKLVTPMICFGSATQNAQLTFWHCMDLYSPDQDELRVYYKTNTVGTWNLLATYTATVSSWTQRTIPLPNPNNTYYIAFEGTAKFGYGVCIDDVSVTGTIAKASQTITFPSIADQVTTNTVVLNATTSSGLPITYSVSRGPATIGGVSNLTFSSTGLVSVVASQTGSVNWAAAPNVTNTFRVWGLYSLTVQSLYGTAFPVVGIRTNILEGVVLTNFVSTPDLRGTTQYVCTGWGMLGNAPGIGMSTTCVITLTNNAQLTWLWATNDWLLVTTNGAGAVSPGSTWQMANSMVSLFATAAPYWLLTGWNGDTNGGAWTSNRLTLLMSQSRNISANFSAIVATNQTPQWWLAQYGLTNGGLSFDAAALSTPDGTGTPAWQKFLTGTDPTNPQSVFRVLNVSISNGAPVVSFFGTTNSGVTIPFGMLRYTNLALPGALVDGNILRSPTGTNVWVDPSSPLASGSVFYRPVTTNNSTLP